MIKKYVTFLLLGISIHITGQTFTDSNLPIVIITTDTNEDTGDLTEIVDEPKVAASMKIIYHEDGSRNLVSDQDNDEFLDYDGRIAIEFRGSTSQNLPKKPYGFETREEDDESNNNVELLDLPKENDWVLNSLAFDKSLIRDYLTYDLARDIGNYASRGRYCEVVVNGDYKGLYILGEKLKIDSDRIDIEDLEDDDNEFPNITGGYYTKADKTTGGDPVAWSYVNSIGRNVNYIHDSPDPEDITPEQNAYIKNVFDDLESTSSVENVSIENGYPSIIDIPSYIDFMLLNEFTSNVDAYQFSTFFHKDRGGKLRAGPIWDFNLSYGNDLGQRPGRSRTDVLQFNNGDNEGSDFWENLFNENTFNCYLNQRWGQITATGQPMNYAVLEDKIDDLVALLSEARLRENEKWNTLNGYETEIINLKNWIQNRITWINNNLSTTSDCSFPEVPNLVISEINYHPEDIGDIDDDDLEFMAITNNSNVAVDVTGFYFQALGISYQFPTNTVVEANQKIYLANNTETFEEFYGFVPFGEYFRNLANSSQQLLLTDAFGNVIDDVTYNDDEPWPEDADGDGAFLILDDLNADNSLPENWGTANILNSNNFELGQNLRIYPNPVASTIFIENSNLIIKKVILYDFLGRVIDVSDNETSTIKLDVNHLSNNNYLLKVVFENDFSVTRIFIKN